MNPDYPEAYIELAVIYSGRSEERIEYLKKAIQLDPYNAVAYDFLGYAYAIWANMCPPQVSDERYKTAIEYCQKASQLDPQYASSYINLQFIYIKLGRYEESVEIGKKALSMNPYDGTAYMNMGYAYGELHKKEEAIANYKKARDIFLAIGNSDAAWAMNESIDRIL